MNQQRWTFVAALFLLLGLGVSVYLVVHHYDLIFGMSDAKSFCSVSAKLDCDAVNTSSFSEVFGIPVAMVALFSFFVELLLLIGFRAFDEEGKQIIGRFFLYLTTGNVLYSIFLGGISTTVLKTFCLMCASLYVISFALWLCAFKLNPRKSFAPLGRDLRELFTEHRGLLCLLLFIPLGSALADGMYKKNISADLAPLIQRSIEDWKNAKQYNFEITSGPEMGNPQATFRIVEFSDFECPHCKRAAPSIHAFVNAHRDQVHFNFQNYPLDSSCNPKGGMHELACSMARASLCALRQNKFTEAHDWIFGHQEILSAESIDRMVQELGLDKESFKTCLSDPATKDELAKEIERGNQTDLSGTPTVFVNGRALNGGFLIPVLEAAFAASK